MMARNTVIGLLTLWAMCFWASAMAQQATSDQSTTITTAYVYLGKDYPHPPPLSLLKKPLPDKGIAGARLSNHYNNITGRLIGREFELIEAEVPADGDVVAKAKALLAAGRRLFVADLKAKDLLAVADLPAAENAIFLNIRARDGYLRKTECRANVFHMIPSRVMRADALAQYLVWKEWTRWFLVRGKYPEDIAYAKAVKRAAKRYGAEIVATRSYKLETGSRRATTGYQQIQTQMPMLTRGVPEYDVLFVADEMNSFGLYLLYRTVQPKLVVGTYGLVAKAWHRSYEQYGAMSLQHSFEDFAGRDMTERDYLAWLSLKLYAKAVVRTDSNDPETIRNYILGQDLDLAAYKGRPLSFRLWNHQLRQPIPLVAPMALVSMAPIRGFMHPEHRMDTLGFSESESQCSLGGG